MEVVPFNHAVALASCAKGDEASFHRLYDHEAPHMLALCRRLVPSDAEGLLHDTFALLWQHADQYDPRMGSARAWIYSVLRHLARQRRIQQNDIPPMSAPWLPQRPARPGKLHELAMSEPLVYKTIAHAYLIGANYARAAIWLNRAEPEVREVTRRKLGS